MKFLVLLLIVAPLIFSQSEYIDDDSFGLSGGYNYSGNDLSGVSGFDFAMTILGSIDLGFQRSSGETEVDYSYSKINSSSNIFYIAYNFKKRENAINLKVLAGYYAGKVNPPQNSTINSSGVILGLGFYPRLVNENSFTVRGAIELVYGLFSSSSNNSYYSNDNSQFDDSRSLSIGVSLNGKISPNVHIVLAPFITKDLISSSSSIFLGISGRLVLTFKKVE